MKSIRPKRLKSGKPRSCDACHQRKIHCDINSPSSSCDWCRHQGILCTFDRPFGRRSKRKAASGGNLEGTTGSATGSLYGASTATQVVSRLTPPSSIDQTRCQNKDLPSQGLGGFYFNGVQIGGISSNQGIPFFSEQGRDWIYAHTSSRPRTLEFAQANHVVEVKGTWDLPDQTIVAAYLSVFARSTRRVVFPIIDEESFAHTTEKAYNKTLDQENPNVACAKACVLAFTCVMAHMDGVLDVPGAVEAEQCAARVNRLMPHILTNPSLCSVQVCTMMCMYNIFSGNVAAAATHLSLAYRFVSMLGGHVNAQIAQPQCETAENRREFIRRVFWHCYMYDKDICLRAGYPPVIDDCHCDLGLPPGYKQIDDLDTRQHGPDLIPGDMRLTIIKSKMIGQLYCARAFHSSPPELLKSIRELDGELEMWRMSIPEPYRPELSQSYRISIEPGWKKSKQIHVVVIHFEYYFLLAQMHSASGRCRMSLGEIADKARLSSCQALALQASRSILSNLAVVSGLFGSGDFWYFILYPMSASLTIFCNILTSPLNPQAEQDLELLNQVPKLISDMCAIPIGATERTRLAQVQQFVEEMLRLSNAALCRHVN
ncbi:fungal-specific transcription factor domain-containing protein [Stachybotrys elegans]|uniref:Fungal-specific transcription factor domain-containing protein n=1 Tax=Stachybotrys elegans TaxID=80388 RepID=A0A8K0SGX5_9HYPO|nr:fungal-specific transcription factor domain-containing protein [Stachybotrys elegans]